MSNTNTKRIISLVMAVAMLFSASAIALAHADTGYTYAAQYGQYYQNTNLYLAQPYGIALDNQGHIYVIDESRPANEPFIFEYTTSGTLVTDFGFFGTGSGQSGLYTPMGIAFGGPNGYVYVADTENNRIAIFTSGGTYVTQITGSGANALSYPRGVAVDAAGNVYVADTGNNRIEVFDNNGNYVTQWTTNNNGQAQSPYYLALDGNGNLYLSLPSANIIQEYTIGGTFVTQWGGSGSGNGLFSNPYGVAVAANGDVYVADSGNSVIQVFSSSGSFLTQFGTPGSNTQANSNAGDLYQPRGIAVDAQGNAYVANTGANGWPYYNDVEFFTASGNFVMPEYAYGALAAVAASFAAVAVLTVVKKRSHA